MARTVNEQDYIDKRNDILNAAQKLVYTKGYERMTIQDILADLHISNGAFYHYFGTKQAVLEAMVEQMQQEAEKPLLPIVQDPHLTAPDKLRRFFATLDGSRAAQKTFLSGLARVWYNDDNAIVRQKVDEAIISRRAPLLNAIVRQGIHEGVFSTPYPDQAGKVILSLSLGMGNAMAKLLLAGGREPAALIAEMVSTHAAYTDAIERAVGATSPFFDRVDAATIGAWFSIEE